MSNEHLLLAEIFLDHLDMVLISAGQSHAVNRVGINGEVSHGRTVLGGHVSDSRAIGEGEVLSAGSMELHELANDSTFAEHLDNGQSQIGSRYVLGHLTGQVESDNLGKHHGNGLAEHDSLSLDATDTPSSDSETVDHGGVGVSTDDGVGVEKAVTVEDDAGE